MIDFKKPVQTRNGKVVRVICTDRKFEYFPVLALVDEKGGECTEIYKSDGSYTLFGKPHPLDLVNVPEETVTYLTYFPRASYVGDRCGDEQVHEPQPNAYGDGRVFFKLTRINNVITKAELFQ